MNKVSLKSLAKTKVGPLVLAKPWPKLHLLSDLHLETGPYEIPADLEYDIVIAAGDISSSVEQAVAWLAAIGKPVIYVLGNHERWGAADLDGAVENAKELAKGSQVRVLERDTVVVQIDGFAPVRFLGATLWTNFGQLAPGPVFESIRGSNDFRHIKAASYATGPRRARVERLCRRHHFAVPEPSNWHPVIAYLEHQEAITWLEGALKQPYFDGPTICVSHHSPSFESLRAFGIAERLLDPTSWSRIRDRELIRVGNYASDLSDLLSRYPDDINLFCHGHLHRGIDVIDAGVRILCNPRGYYEKPLSTEVGALWALFGGWPVSEATIKRDQERHAANPFCGEALHFDRRLTIDLTDGLARPLSQVVFAERGPLANMRGLRREAVRLSKHLNLRNTVPAECVREVFADKCAAFTNELNSFLNMHIRHLIKNSQSKLNIEERLWPSGVPKPCAPFVFPGDKPDLKRHYLVQLDWMASWISWTKALPWAAKAAVLEWQRLIDRAVQALNDKGITVWYEPLPDLSLRRLSDFLECFNLVVLYVEDIELVKATVDSLVNQSKPTRQYFVRVSSLKDVSEDTSHSRGPLLLRSNSTEPIRSISETISQL
jgi:hypothetical protein